MKKTLHFSLEMSALKNCHHSIKLIRLSINECFLSGLFNLDQPQLLHLNLTLLHVLGHCRLLIIPLPVLLLCLLNEDLTFERSEGPNKKIRFACKAIRITPLFFTQLWKWRLTLEIFNKLFSMLTKSHH